MLLSFWQHVHTQGPRSTTRGFWSTVCRYMGGWSATPEGTRYFLALCSSKTSILGIQKHLYWLVVCSGTGVGSATPEPTAYFLALRGSKTPILGIQKHLFWPVVCSGMGVWSATPEPTAYFWALCTSKTPILGIKNTFFGLWCAVVWVVGVPPQNPHNIFCHSAV